MTDKTFEAMLRGQNPAAWEALQKAQAERGAVARGAARMALRRARCEAPLKAVEAYNNSTVGTPPVHIFGTRGAALCRSFLQEMDGLRYPRILQLKLTPEWEGKGLNNLQTYGYYLGELVIPEGRLDEFTPAGNEKRAFLCADGQLRAATKQSHAFAGNYPRFVDNDDQVQWMGVDMTIWTQERKWVPGGRRWVSTAPDVDIDGPRRLSGGDGGGYEVFVPDHWQATGRHVEVPATLDQRLADIVKYAVKA